MTNEGSSPNQYVIKEDAITAIQMTSDNTLAVLDFLNSHQIEYSYDEIKSGGMIIVYTSNGPIVMLPGWWLFVDNEGKYPRVFNDEIFRKHYTLR